MGKRLQLTGPSAITDDELERVGTDLCNGIKPLLDSLGLGFWRLEDRTQCHKSIRQLKPENGCKNAICSSKHLKPLD